SGAYTFSRTLDDTTSYSVGGIKVQNPFNRRAEKGLSDIHRAQKFSSSAIYNLPALKNLNPAARYVFGDWELSTIVTAGTGTPFTVVSGRNQSLDGLGADRPDLVGDPLAVT